MIPKKRKFSNVSLDSVDSLLDDDVSFPPRDTYPVRLVPMNRSQTSESEISLEQNTEGKRFICTIGTEEFSGLLIGGGEKGI